jgi:hypothetical protein
MGGLAEFNYAEILQEGNENNAEINQGLNGATTIHSEATILQYGMENEGLINQAGANQMAEIIQKGMGNTAIATQE